MNDDKRGEPRRQAFIEFVLQDSTLLNPETAMQMRRERLRDSLEVLGVKDVDEAVKITQKAILEIVRARSVFRMEILNDKVWQPILANYQNVQAEEAKLPKDRRLGQIDSDLYALRGKLGDVLRGACRVVVPREELEELLAAEGIKTRTDTVVRLLISEINAEGPRPRIIGLLSSFGPHYKPHYVALPEMEFSVEFFEVCRIFDH